MSDATTKVTVEEEIDPNVPIIEIEDDTPEADRGRQRRPEGVDPEIPTDEELANYTPSVKRRLAKMKAEFHEERRRAEEAQRQNSEAVRLVKHLKEELVRTRGFARDRDKEALSGAQATVEAQLSQARRDVTEAFTNGDTEKFGEATERVARLAAAAERLKVTPPAIPDEAVIQEREASFGGMRGDAATVADAAASPDAKAVAWGARNPWFGKDNRLTAAAYGIHADLVQEGRVAIGSDEYYRVLDAELRRIAPDRFRGSDEDRSSDREGRSSTGRRASPSSSVVSSSGRSSVASGGRRVVRITASQAALAKKLGITNEQYVAEMMKLESES